MFICSLEIQITPLLSLTPYSPSSSRDDQLPNSYYQAEADGLQQQCALYDADCPHNIMDLISVPMERILTDLANRRRRK